MYFNLDEKLTRKMAIQCYLLLVDEVVDDDRDYFHDYGTNYDDDDYERFECYQG